MPRPPLRADPPPLTHLRVALELDIPSDVRYIERVVDLVRRQCETLEFGARQCALNVPVALSEALSNAILRGNRDHAEQQVRVRANVDSERLVVEVCDQGEGFDIDACMQDPTSPENLVREDGRGLFLMARLMDRVERFTDHGNVVRMMLRRSG
jgi:serine/threonine-protein kinase RsbW